MIVGAILILTVGVALGGNESESKVLVLTEENYDEVINNTPLILVEFYAPWYVASTIASKL